VKELALAEQSRMNNKPVDEYSVEPVTSVPQAINRERFSAHVMRHQSAGNELWGVAFARYVLEVQVNAPCHFE
jgi:hypothetical protein